MNLQRNNEEHRKRAQEQVIGSGEDAEETHHEEGEDQEVEDVIPNLEIDYEYGEYFVLDSEYEYENDSG